MTISLSQLPADTPSPQSIAPESAHIPGQLLDAHNRQIKDLRLSITDRCNMRCTYCMDPDTQFAPKDTLLTRQELVRIASICVGLGITRIRLTGGEPTIRPDLTQIIKDLSRLEIDDLAMTTNGVGYDPKALEEWQSAGLNRVTLSLDSLNTQRFQQVTRSPWQPADVIKTIRHAVTLQLTPVRINCVVVRGFNDDEVVQLAYLTKDLGAELRLIEFMPLDGGHRWKKEQVVPSIESFTKIDSRIPLTPLDRERDSETSTRFAFSDGSPGGIGFVSPVSNPFCGACSRLRITADGKVRACLFGTDEGDLRTPIRSEATNDTVRKLLRDIVWNKRSGHGIGTPEFERPTQAMNGIGG